MISNAFVSKISVVFILVLFCLSSQAQDKTEAQIEVGLRTIGHQILLWVGDSTSRVLPIEKEKDGYLIKPDTRFAFEPGALVAEIDKVVQQTELASHYVVQVRQCSSDEVVHAYEYDPSKREILPCKGRALPEDCYYIFFQILKAPHPLASLDNFVIEPGQGGKNEKQGGSWILPSILAVLFLGLIFWTLYFWKKRNSNPKPETILPSNTVSIGSFQFNPGTLLLSRNNETTELSGKEADLLMLLHASTNSTLERDDILKKVWGDEGDYVGRTLDVFISKLRKKLEADPDLKIVNVRGVGYRLVERGMVSGG
jgi:DNA-binding winged helix-turn-helix (wHTH) protein